MKRTRPYEHREEMRAVAQGDGEAERRKLTLEALCDVDAGRVVDHLEVKVWADSLATDEPVPVPRP
jgi:predicted transcriptional regulator